MHCKHYRICPRYYREVLRVWLTLSNILMLWCLGITVTGIGDIGSLALLRICWPYILLVISLSWIISVLLCWWRPLGLVLSVIIFVLILPQTPIGSLSFCSTTYHRRRCLSTPQMLDWRDHFYMIFGYRGPELFNPIHLSLGRSMRLVLYTFESPSLDSYICIHDLYLCIWSCILVMQYSFWEIKSGILKYISWCVTYQPC